MGRQELISPEGLRQDGRRPNEIRSFSGDMGILGGDVDGSAIFELGNTRVMASVVGPREALEKTFIAAESDVGFLTVRCHAAAFSSTGGERRARNDRRLQEWARLVEGALTSTVMAEAFPRSAVDIFVEILNADGSFLAAIINAVTLALIDAGIPMKDYVTAVNVAFVQSSVALLDPNRMEESGAGSQPSLTAAFLPRTGHVVLTSAEPRMAADKIGALMKLASVGAGKIFEKLDTETVRPRLSFLFNQRTAVNAANPSKQ
jgi:exosome complex component RRP41